MMAIFVLSGVPSYIFSLDVGISRPTSTIVLSLRGKSSDFANKT
jgi:hypothetical protein